jgi:hypothetical protein
MEKEHNEKEHSNEAIKKKAEDNSLAIAALKKTKQKLREEYEQSIADLDRVIANLERSEKKAAAANGEIGRGKWQGMEIAPAVQAFLSNFDKPVKFSTIMKALQDAGVDMGDPARPNRFAANVKTTISNNRKRFRYNKRRDTVRLLLSERAAAAS